MNAATLRVFALVAGLLTACASLAQPGAWQAGSDGLAPIPPLSARVTDLTATLSQGERAALEAKLAKWEEETGNQLAVLLVPSTQPEPIEAYAIRVADAWKIGRKGRDNGALLVVAKDDRRLRIEVGYGFEGSLTDATSRRIIAETITPLFRQNRFGDGINAGVDQMIAVIGKGEPLASSAEPRRRSPAASIPLEMWLILLLVGVPILGSILRGIFGKVGGATVGAGLVGVGAGVIASSILIGVAAAILAWAVLLFMGGGGGGVVRSGRGGTWGPYIGGGGGGSWGGGGGGWSGGGGGFGGGGASGSW